MRKIFIFLTSLFCLAGFPQVAGAQLKNLPTHIDLRVHINMAKGVLQVSGTSNKKLLLPKKAINVVPKGDLTFQYEYPLPSKTASRIGLNVWARTPLGMIVPDMWYPGSRLNGKHRMTYTIDLSIRQPWVALVPGKISKETRSNGLYRATFSIDQKTGSIPLSAGPFIYKEARHGDLTYRTYFPKQLGKLQPFYMKMASVIFDSYGKRIGAYPVKNMSIVTSPVPLRSYASQGFIMLDIEGIKEKTFVLSTFPHELLHGYWGGGVYAPLNFANWAEGLTTYMSEYIFAMQFQPKAAKGYLRKWQESVASVEPVSVLKFKGHMHDDNQRVGYHKVAMVFHMLHQRLGGEVFNRVTRRLWENFKFKVVMWADFERMFAEESGKDVEPFFNTWVRGKKVPSMADLEATELNAGLELKEKKCEWPCAKLPPLPIHKS